jgi:outer membrane autotransporter protein
LASSTWTATSDATLEVVPVGYAAAGDYTIIQASTTLGDGAFTTVTAPALFAGTVSGGDGGFVLALTRHSYADFVQRPELASLGRALDRVAPHATGGVAAMLNRIDNYAAGASISAALRQLQPAINASASAATLEGVHRTGSLLAANEQPCSAGVAGRGMAWFGALDGREKHGAAGGFRALDVDTDGGMAGVDFPLGARFSVGAAVADVRERLDERTSADRADTDTQRGYLRARWDERPGAAGWHAAAHVGFGSTRIETRRRIDFLEADVEGAHRAWDLSAAVGGGRDFVYRRWTLRPFAEAEYVRLNERAYAERGGSGGELAFERRRTESLLAGAGLAVGTHFELGGIVLQPELRLRRARELCGTADGLIAAFAGGDAFASPARPYSRDRMEVGGSFGARLAERIAFSVFATRTDFGGGDDSAQELGCRVQVVF